MSATVRIRVKFIDNDQELPLTLPATATMQQVITEVRRHRGWHHERLRFVCNGHLMDVHESLAARENAVMHCVASPPQPAAEGPPPGGRPGGPMGAREPAGGGSMFGPGFAFGPAPEPGHTGLHGSHPGNLFLAVVVSVLGVFWAAFLSAGSDWFETQAVFLLVLLTALCVLIVGATRESASRARHVSQGAPG
eukprot:jgi/Mesvir1/16311/Mv12763-RA.1